MKSVKIKAFDEKIKVLIPETPMEAVEALETFFEADMWHAKGAEWKTEAEMLKYIRAHFKICKNQIKDIESGKVQSMKEIDPLKL